MPDDFSPSPEVKVAFAVLDAAMERLAELDCPALMVVAFNVRSADAEDSEDGDEEGAPTDVELCLIEKGVSLMPAEIRLRLLGAVHTAITTDDDEEEGEETDSAFGGN